MGCDKKSTYCLTWVNLYHFAGFVYFRYTFRTLHFLSVSMDNIEFKRLRVKLGLTQLTLSVSLGLSKNTVARVERGDWPVRKVISMAMRYLEISSSNVSVLDILEVSVTDIPSDLKPLDVSVTDTFTTPHFSIKDTKSEGFFVSRELSLDEIRELNPDFDARYSRKRELALKKQAQFDAIANGVTVTKKKKKNKH